MQSLTHLSDDELVSQLMACCSEMRSCKVRLLVFLADVEERRIHLKAAASSMWDFARRFLSMSHGSAYRFIACSRLCRRFPFLLERIERGELHVSTLAHIASWITADNVEDLIAETAGRNRGEIDLVLRRRFGVEPVHHRAGNPLPYDEELLKMVERARELLSHSIPNGDRLAISKIAYRLLIEALEKKKRGKGAAARKGAETEPHAAPTKPTKEISRHATRAMFERDGDQCSFVDERTGARCPSRAFIQRDHIHMRARGGGHEPENLQPMCGPHNLLLAELALGREYVQRRIRNRRGNRGSK